MQYIKKAGHDVEIIDYRPPYLRTQCNLLAISSKWVDRPRWQKLLYLVAKVPSRLVWPFRSCKPAFDQFTQQNLRVTETCYRTPKQLKRNPPEADLYIVGSDQVWNTFYQNGRDPAFYLDFGPESAKRISYAGSFSSKEVKPEYAEFVKQSLDRFDSISVREADGLTIIASMGLPPATHVLDPVFLLDASEWESVVDEPKPDEKYLLLYDFENTDEIKGLVQRFAAELNLKIYSVNNYKANAYCDRDFSKHGPKTFLSLLKNAELVVCSSFHATAFSIIFGKEFFVIPRRGQPINSRMESVLNDFDLRDRLLEHPEAFDLAQVKPLNKKRLQSRLAERVVESKNYLNQFLK
jgi:polysaccharide pyruvyl transferase WcaK-like protein